MHKMVVLWNVFPINMRIYDDLRSNKSSDLSSPKKARQGDIRTCKLHRSSKRRL